MLLLHVAAILFTVIGMSIYSIPRYLENARNIDSAELNVKNTSHLIKIRSVFTLTLYITRI